MAGPASGINVDDSCIATFFELQKNKKFRYIIFKIDDEHKYIGVEKVGDRDVTYEQFQSELEQMTSRYVVFDYENPKESKKSKVLFILWNPDQGKIKEKMLYASSMQALKTKLPGVQKEMQCTDSGELMEDLVMKKCFSGDNQTKKI